ncbi:probable GEL1 protein [Rhynchosporium secalis]|uniref:1,3-beta-glucanosyltransferase n=1 Tax=Rhynchosporium secalis TaxID=38038 RepID=A0A1E1MJY4_RHYSE|nr:probable GEL1 protein [Rhynchosporium secalis]
MKTFAVAAALAATLVSAVPEQMVERASSLPAITVKGNAFFNGNTRFYMRGVDYQPGGSSKLADPIADPATCKRDIAEFQKLGINTVRIYTVDNSANHDDCMSQLAAAGIYLVLDVNSPLYSLNRKDPHPSYNAVYLQNIFATIDAFSKYTNTLAFFSGNEVINDDSTTPAAPYVKAVTRDMRAYIKARKYRQIPVGYSAADVNSNRKEMAEYMNCGSDDERSDFFAFNDYSWCDPSSFTTSGWDQKVKNFTGYGLPIFLSEFGCNTNTRKWQEVKSLYSTDMSAVYSGGLVYEYSQEEANYGLVEISGSTVSPLPDFTALQAAFKGTPNPSGDGGYNSTGGASGCPAKSANWEVSSNDLPAIPAAAAAMMKDGAGKGIGLTGKGSQNAGGTSSSTVPSGSGSGTSSGTQTSGKPGATSKGAAPAIQVPFNAQPLFVSAIALGFTALGAFLL